jgi:hypothetical protein
MRSLLLLLWSSAALAYEAPTHAGLTERAALAAGLHQRLTSELSRALGLYETLKLMPADAELERRLAKLDPEGGYAPDGGKQTALGWLVAGAVLEGVPASRTRNHFFDPQRQGGLDQNGSAVRTRVGAAVTGIGSLRGIFTGSNFDGSGRSSIEWLTAAKDINEWGLTQYLDQRERAVAAPTAAERDDALARALLSAGAIAHLIEDAGDPAFVHDDWQRAIAVEGAPYETWVAARLGRLAIPGPAPAGAPIIHLVDIIHNSSGQGLSDRTARRFFSPGSLPSLGTTPPPSLQPPASSSGYVSSPDVAHLAAYRKEPAGVVYWLDERCHKDYADALLPEIERAVVTALDHLFRGRLEIAAADGAIEVRAADVALGKGRVTLFAEDENGNRKPIASAEVSGPAEVLLRAQGEARKLSAVFRGVDAAGEPIVVAKTP